MKLIDALRILGQDRSKLPTREILLATGFTPLHLETFLAATAQQRLPAVAVQVRTGLFGDFVGNLERCLQSSAGEVVAVFEWADLDPRLGWRGIGGWTAESLPDIEATVGGAVTRIVNAAESLAAAGKSTALCFPTLPLLPASHHPGHLLGSFEAGLRVIISSASQRLASVRGLRVVNAQRIDMLSPLADRADVRGEIATGFPYRQPHAVVLARLLVEALLPATPKKGLVTDLDDTVWKGILGDVGVSGIACSLESHAQVHAIYQQFLLSLASSGALLAIASKNDEALVAEALLHTDVAVRREHFYPLQVHWRPKSESMAAILETWNVAPDSVVFVDDSPIELAEVQARFPDVECLLFPKDDPAEVVQLVTRLRDLFGKPEIREEDRLRLESLRNSSAIRELRTAPAEHADAFLESVGAELTIELTDGAADGRAFELVNKTNQFNLNGRRFSESEWAAYLAGSARILMTVSYADKFGKLGKVAALLVEPDESRVHISSWVMSCRAFSRRIEYQCLRVLFEQFSVDEVVLDFVPTPRNGPLQEFIAAVLDEPLAQGALVLRRSHFEQTVPPLYHALRITTQSATT